jgi:hypothetical protein
MKHLPSILILFLITGCARPEIPGAKMGWGKAREVLHANSKSITFRYDKYIAQPSSMYDEAQKHCEQHGADAVRDTEVMDGGLFVTTFLCEKV